MKKIINVAIIEDDLLIGNGLMSYLNSSNGFKCIAHYPSCIQAIEKIKLNLPDVLLMDISMPEMSGIECTKILKCLFNDLIIIMLTVFNDDKKIFDSLKAGASGYILKQTPMEKILDMIKEAYEGGAPMTPSIARKVLNYFNESNKQIINYHLSKREKEILDELVTGSTYNKISETLFISIDTVRTHIKNIYSKLHVNSKAEAVAKALKNKII